MTHICVGNLIIIGSDNGLSPGRCQAITWTNAAILLIGPLGTNLSEILIKIHTFSFRKMHLKMSSGKWQPFCLALNVLTDDVCGIIWGGFYKNGLTWIPAFISNNVSSGVWDEIIFPFPNFNSCIVKVWKWINNFIPYFIMDVITYPCWGWI